MSLQMTEFQNEVGLLEAVREVVATAFGLPTSEVHAAFSAADTPAWDSLHHFTLIVTLEDRFGVTYTSDEIPGMTSVPAIARVTARHLGIDRAS
jgi:acyl carrier protein